MGYVLTSAGRKRAGGGGRWGALLCNSEEIPSPSKLCFPLKTKAARAHIYMHNKTDVDINGCQEEKTGDRIDHNFILLPLFKNFHINMR